MGLSLLHDAHLPRSGQSGENTEIVENVSLCKENVKVGPFVKDVQVSIFMYDMSS